MFLKKYSHSPIARKLLFITIGVSTLIALIITISQLVYDYYQDIQRIENTLQQIKIASVPSIVVSLWNLDDEQVKVQLQSLMKIPEVIRVEIEQPKKDSINYGEIIDDSFFFKKYGFKLIFTRDDSTEVSLGMLNVAYDFKNIYMGLLEKLVFIFLLNCVKTLAVSFVLLFVFWRLVTSHIINISDQLNKHKETLLNKDSTVLNDQSGLGEIDILIKSINKLYSSVVDVKVSNENEKNKEERAEILKDEFMADYSLLLASKEKNLSYSLINRIIDELSNVLSDCSINVNEIKLLHDKIEEVKGGDEQLINFSKEVNGAADKIKQVVTTSTKFMERIKSMFAQVNSNDNMFFYKNDLHDAFNDTSSFIKRNHLVIEDDIIFSADPLVIKRLLWIVFFLIYQVDKPKALKTSIYKRNMNIYIVVSYPLDTVINEGDSNSVLDKLTFELYVVDLFVQHELKGSFSYDVDDDLGAEWVISFPSLI